MSTQRHFQNHFNTVPLMILGWVTAFIITGSVIKNNPILFECSVRTFEIIDRVKIVWCAVWEILTFLKKMLKLSE